MVETRAKLARRVVREAGGYLRESLGRREGIEKGAKHVAAPVDFSVDAFVLREVQRAFPQDSLLSEESGFTRGRSDYVWVVDPVDGTSNLRLGIPYASSAVAVVRNGETIFAAVYNPFNEEMFTAEKGAGAFLDGRRIHVSKRTDALEGFYQQGYAVPSPVEMQVIGALTAISIRVLNMWCPSLDWCNLALGRAEFLVACQTEVEDLVQGRLILEEAGGRVTSWNGGPVEIALTPGERLTIVASNGVVHDEVRSQLPR